MSDDERLLKTIADSLSEVERYFDTDELEAETAFRALDRADAAMEKLNAEQREFRDRLNDIVLPDVWPFDAERERHGGLHVVRAKPRADFIKLGQSDTVS